MVMDEQQILTDYKLSKDQRNQVQILADLNGCDKKYIISILQKNGLHKHVIGAYDLELQRKDIIQHFENGGTHSALASKYHTDGNRIKKVLEDMGIYKDGKYVKQENCAGKCNHEVELMQKTTLISSLKVDLQNEKSKNNVLINEIALLKKELEHIADNADEVPENELVAAHKKVCDCLNKLYAQKNRAYGNSFGRTYEDLGIISAVTRISDKFNRLCNLAKNSDCPTGDESIADTLLDLANYAIMTYMQVVKENAKN